MSKPQEVELHIPEGINYECTGCGKCCGGWAIPMTEEDYLRISQVDWAKANAKFAGKDLFRPMKDYEKKGTTYTHAIRPGTNGHCPFLIDNLCFIHSLNGAEAKPSVCQLFPYCFSETPSGVFATVSFISVGAVYNSGQALSAQKDLLLKKYAEFRRLFPDQHPDWSNLKFVVGQPMTWDEYLKHEEKLLSFLAEKDLPIEERLLKGSAYLAMQLGTQKAAPADTKTLKKIDRHLLCALHKLYFPVKPLGHGQGNFSVFRFAYQFLYQSSNLKLPLRSFKIEELAEFPFADDPESQDVLYRWLYSRLFGKFYFGGGFGQLSLLAGFHHLILAYCLAKLQAKAFALERQAPRAALVDVVSAVRQLEKRLGETSLNGYAAAVWELLMYSPARIKRIMANI